MCEDFVLCVVFDVEQGLFFGVSFVFNVFVEFDCVVEQVLFLGCLVFLLILVESDMLLQFVLMILLMFGEGEMVCGVILQGVVMMQVLVWEGEDVFLLDIFDNGNVFWVVNMCVLFIKCVVVQLMIVCDFFSFLGGVFFVFEYDMCVGLFNWKMIGQILRFVDMCWVIFIQKLKLVVYWVVIDFV